MADIFISYASEDRSRVEPLAKALENQGWSIFWDFTIPVGKTWRQVITEALDAAKCAVVVWSSSAINSDWVHEEAEEAQERKILVPIMIDRVKPPLGFRRMQAARLMNWSGDPNHPEFEKLLKSIEAILGPSPLEVKEAEVKRAEEERIRKQEEERKRRKDEQRKAEEERQRLEEEKQRLAKEKSKFEEDQKRIEAASKAEKEYKQEKADTKLKAVEEERRKERKDSSNKDTKKIDDYGVLIKKVFLILITVLLSAAIGIATVWLFPIVHYNTEWIRVYDIEGTTLLIAILAICISWVLVWRKKITARIFLIGFIVCAGLGYGIGILLPSVIEGWVDISINFSLTGAFIGLVFGLLCSLKL